MANQMNVPTDTTAYSFAKKTSNPFTYGTPVAFSAGTTTLTWEDVWQINNSVLPTDQADLNATALVSVANHEADVASEELDEYVRDEWATFDLSAVVNKFDATGTTVNQNILGGMNTANAYVDLDDGASKGTAKDTGQVYKALSNLQLALMKANKVSPTGARDRVWTLVMHPAHYINLRDYLAAQNSSELLAGFTLDGRSIMRLWDMFDVMQSSAIISREIVPGTGEIGTSSTKDGAYIYCVNMTACTYGERFNNMTVFPPGVNQDGHYWKFHMIVQTYAKVLDPRFLYRVPIRAEA